MGWAWAALVTQCISIEAFTHKLHTWTFVFDLPKIFAEFERGHSQRAGDTTSAGWQVTLCDPIWHVSSRSGVVLVAQTAIRFVTLPYILAMIHART